MWIKWKSDSVHNNWVFFLFLQEHKLNTFLHFYSKKICLGFNRYIIAQLVHLTINDTFIKEIPLPLPWSVHLSIHYTPWRDTPASSYLPVLFGGKHLEIHFVLPGFSASPCSLYTQRAHLKSSDQSYNSEPSQAFHLPLSKIYWSMTELNCRCYCSKEYLVKFNSFNHRYMLDSMKVSNQPRWCWTS